MTVQFWFGVVVGFVVGIPAGIIGLFLYITWEPENDGYERPA